MFFRGDNAHQLTDALTAIMSVSSRPACRRMVLNELRRGYLIAHFVIKSMRRVVRLGNLAVRLYHAL